MDNVFKFKYLGSLFAADGQHCYDINARVAMAMSRCGKLKHIFDSKELGPRLKLRLYIAAICSLLTYGCESWCLTQEVMQKLNGANARMLSRITGNSARAEAKSATASYDLVRNIRARRLKWLGQILRGDKDALLFQAIKYHHDNYTKGNIFMDAPPHNDLKDLICMSYDNIYWNSLKNEIPSHLRKSNSIYRED